MVRSSSTSRASKAGGAWRLLSSSNELWVRLNRRSRPMSSTNPRNWSATKSISGTDMASGVSSFYPPRARWYSPCLALGAGLRRRLGLVHIHLPPESSIGGVLAAALVPGAGFYVRGPRFWGKIAMAFSGALFVLMVAWLGYPVATLAFGLLLAIHVSALTFLFEPMLPAHFRARLLFAGGVLVLLAASLYLPARHLIQDQLFLPLRFKDRVIVIHRGKIPGDLQRGEVMAYSFESITEHQLIVRGGFGLGPVLA